jgi:hypothetical protein
MTNTNLFFSRSQSSGQRARRRSQRLQLESLESRRVLTTAIAGAVISDLNGNGVIDEGEPGQDNVRVYIDANGNDMLDISGTSIEPDDYADGGVIDGSAFGITFSVVDDNNQVIAGEGPIRANVDPFASTGDQVFARGEVEIWYDQFRLRVDFDTPAFDVSINYTGGHAFFPQIGVLTAFDASGNELATYETQGVVNGEFETMRIDRPQGDIAWIVAHTKRLNSLPGRLDALRFNSGNSENWTVTDPEGQYQLNVPTGGTYRVNEVVPAGFQQTLPNGDGGQNVTVTTDTIATGVNFANREITNQAPVAMNDTAQTAEDTAVTVNVLQNDTDDNAIDASTVVVSTTPANGSVEVNPTTGAITYTPNQDFAGTDTFSYTVEDNEGLVSNPATVTITVNAVNDAPVAVADSASTSAGEAVSINVLANDTDVDSALNPGSTQVVSMPSDGTVSVNAATGAITYTPASGFTGTDSFTYTVADTGGAVSNEATVTVTVSSVLSGWQNQTNPLDINNDGIVVPFDALLVINELNQPQYRDPITGELPPAPNPVPFFFDVNGDGFASPFDAILIINFLNGQAAPAAVAVSAMAEGEAPVAPLPAASVDSVFAAALADDDAFGKKRK